LRNLAHSLCGARRFDEAAALCVRYLQLHPEGDARVWIDQGICQHARGDGAAAEASFRRALAQSPEDVVARTNLGSVLIDRGHRELPIEATFVGRKVQTTAKEIIKVSLRDVDSADKVLMLERD